MAEDVNIEHIEDSVGNIGNKQLCVETGNDAQTGHRMWAGKDGAGNTYKFLGKGRPAYIQNLNVSDFSNAGLLRTDTSGNITGDINTLGELNASLGGTTIDESTDERDPAAHALGGSAHTSATLSELNALVSDATLDDSGDTRPPSAHALGSASHTSATLSELNAKISDANLPHDMSGTSESGDALDVIEGGVVGSTSKFSVENRVATLLTTGSTDATDQSHLSCSVASGNNGVYTNTLGNMLKRYAVNTLNEIEEVASDNRALLMVDGKLLVLRDNFIYEHNPNDLSDSYAIPATGADFIFAADYNPFDGKIYAILSSTGMLVTLERDISEYIVTSKRILTELRNPAYARNLKVSEDGTKLFVSDFSSSAGGNVVRAFLTDGVNVYTSDEVTITSPSASLGLHRGMLTLDVTGTIYYMSQTDLSTLHVSATTLLDGPSCVCGDGSLVHIDVETGTMTPKRLQLPGLTNKIEGYQDNRLSHGINSAPGVVAYGETSEYEYTNADIARVVEMSTQQRAGDKIDFWITCTTIVPAGTSSNTIEIFSDDIIDAGDVAILKAEISGTLRSGKNVVMRTDRAAIAQDGALYAPSLPSYIDNISGAGAITLVSAGIDTAWDSYIGDPRVKCIFIHNVLDIGSETIIDWKMHVTGVVHSGMDIFC